MRSRIGIFMPIALMFLVTLAAAQSTTFCTSQTNMSTGETAQFNLAGVQYNVNQNFITPSTAGMTINGQSYSMSPNVSQTIDSGSGSYVEITQINYIPIQPSLNFILCSAHQDAATQYNFNLSANQYGDLLFTYFGTRLEVIPSLSSSQAFSSYPTKVTMANVTATAPAPPSGYAQIITISVDVAASISATINVTQDVPCDISPSAVAVYLLVQGSWHPVTGYAYDSGLCKVTASVPGNNPEVGIFERSGSSTAPTSSSSSTTTSTGTTSPTTTVHATTRPTTTISTTVKTTSTTSRSTTQSTSTISTGTTTPYPTPSTTATASSRSTASTSVPASTSYQVPANWPSDAILGAIALLCIYLVYLLAQRFIFKPSKNKT